LRNLYYLLYCVYLFLAYHLLVISAFAEFSFYALLVVPIMIGAFWLIPAEHRKEIVVFTLMFLFIHRAIVQISTADRPLFFVWVIFIGLFLYPIVRWYAQIRLPALVIALSAALIFALVLPNRTVQALAHLYPKWSSEKLYIGTVSPSFPVAVADINANGRDEIITLGNADDYPEGSRRVPFGTQLENEPLHFFVWEWNNGTLERVPNEELDADELRGHLPKDFIAFPYYVLNEDLELEPLVQRQSLTESMVQFGTAPFQAMRLNLQNIIRQLEINGGIYDYMGQSGQFDQLLLERGMFSGIYEGEAFSVPSPASKIIGSIELANGQEGILVLGSEVQLLQMIDGEMQVTNTLTREMQSGLALSQFIIRDMNGNGLQDLVVTFPFSSIYEPTADGSWNILWSTAEKSFNIKDVGSFTADGRTEILALRKSMVRASDTNYLTSYRYSDKGLVQNWKIFLRNIDTAEFADLDGDGERELVTTIYNKHQINVWGKHNIPVTGILIGLTLVLLLYLAGRRYAYAKKKSV
jgi:hypothetical protein